MRGAGVGWTWRTVVTRVPVEATSDVSDTPAVAYTSCPVEHRRCGRKPVIAIEGNIESRLRDHKEQLDERAEACRLSVRKKLAVNKVTVGMAVFMTGVAQNGHCQSTVHFTRRCHCNSGCALGE